MIIEKVKNLEEANKCDELLTKLIKSESAFNENIKSDFIVKDYFASVYNKSENVLYVAKEENKIIGYVFCKIISEDGGVEVNPEALVDGLYVEKEYRNKRNCYSIIEKCTRMVH